VPGAVAGGGPGGEAPGDEGLGDEGPGGEGLGGGAVAGTGSPTMRNVPSGISTRNPGSPLGTMPSLWACSASAPGACRSATRRSAR